MIERVAARGGPNRRSRGSVPLLCRFRNDRQAAVAIEFGLVAMPFFAITFAIFEIAFLFMTGEALDTSLDAAARQLMTGQAQTSTGANAITNMATFKQFALCPKLPAIITCSNVTVNIAQIASFSQANLGEPISNGALNTSSWGYKPCASGQIMKVEAIYPVAALTSFWTSPYTVTVNGVRSRILYSSTVFRCEPF